MPSQAGLNTSAPATYLQPDELVIADNIYFGLSGERRKRLGTARYNASAVSATGNITAMADFWRYGASLSPTQKIVFTSGTNIYTSPGDGTFSSINAAWGTNTSLLVNIIIAQGYAVFSNGSDAPRKYDQTTESALDGGTGGVRNFAFASYHLRRLFAAGIAAEPSTIDVSAGGDITTWNSGDTVRLPLDSDDGDIIQGISRPFHKRLYIFKGPNKGSIHEIGGNDLTTFTHDRIFEGLPAQNHKGIITTSNDIFWISPEGVHSLITTANYGDTTTAFLSLPIQNLWRDNLLTPNALNQAVGFWSPIFGIVGWAVEPSGASKNTWALIYHYLLSDPSPGGKKMWSIWKFSGGVAPYSAATMITPTTQSVGPSLPRLYFGGSGDGFIYSGDQTTLTDGNGSAYTARLKTGINLNFGVGKDALREAQMYALTTFYEPVGTYTHDLNITVDGRTTSTSITMSGLGDTLG